jgi:maltose O-acetyltransferase
MREFNPLLPEHLAARKRAKKLCMQINATTSDQFKLRTPLYQQLFGAVSSAFIEPDFFCDYGYNIFLGESFFANHHCIFLDAEAIRIGDRVMLGPNVHLYTTTHPTNAQARAQSLQQVAPITIANDCWIGGNSIIMPGVTIGAGSVIGAGSIVTQSIPEKVIALGSPCKAIRACDE